MEIYYIYLLRCRGGILYTGITKDPARRFKEHSERAPQGAKFTRAHPVEKVELLWQTEGRSAASRLEYRIKQLKKAQKELLIREPHRLSELLGAEFDSAVYSLTEPKA